MSGEWPETCSKCQYDCNPLWLYCPNCGNKLGWSGGPDKRNEEVTFKLSKLWVIQIEPARKGLKTLAKKGLEESSIRPVDYNTGGLILLPPPRDHKDHFTPFFIDAAKDGVEKSGNIRVKYEWPYGFFDR